jgi:hypothetical protein
MIEDAPDILGNGETSAEIDLDESETGRTGPIRSVLESAGRLFGRKG